MKNLILLLVVFSPLFGFSQKLTPNEKNLDSLLTGKEWIFLDIKWFGEATDSIPYKWNSERDSLFYEFLKGEWKTVKVEFKPAPQDQSPKWQPGYHPELKEGEMLWDNISSLYYYDEKTELYVPDPNALNINFNKIEYKIKRLGKIAYDPDGNKLDNMRPVFIKMSE